MTVNRKIPRDEFDILMQRIKKLETDVSFLRNQKRPTVPIYDPTDYPQDAVEGQVAVGNDNSLHFYSNGAWHDVGVGFTPEIAFYDWVGTYTGDRTVYPYALNYEMSLETTSAPGIFDIDSGNIRIKETGVYRVYGFISYGNITTLTSTTDTTYRVGAYWINYNPFLQWPVEETTIVVKSTGTEIYESQFDGIFIINTPTYPSGSRSFRPFDQLFDGAGTFSPSNVPDIVNVIVTKIRDYDWPY